MREKYFLSLPRFLIIFSNVVLGEPFLRTQPVDTLLNSILSPDCVNTSHIARSNIFKKADMLARPGAGETFKGQARQVLL